MSADDQHFLDLLSGVPVHLRRYASDVADFVDRNVDRASLSLRDTFSGSSWIPESIRPDPVPRPSTSAAAAAAASSRLEVAQRWVARHKFITGLILVVCGSVAYTGYQRSCRRWPRKARRAKRARNGGRVDVVVVAGSPTLPLTKSLSLDLERRGFVVFVVCNAAEDENMVHAFSRPDIRPLTIDTTDPPRAGAAIERFARYLQSPQAPGPQVKPNQLTLKSVILIPSLHYQTSPIATIPPSSFADLFNTHLLQPILTIQAFLPLLTSRLNPVGEKWIPPKVLVFTPSIISSINPPFHAPEATVCSALSAFTEVLTAELGPLDIPVTHVQLGTFDFSGFSATGRSYGPLIPTTPHETLVWPDGARHVYGRNYVAQNTSAISGGRIGGFKGSSLRCLHTTVFDVIDGSITSHSVRVGLGAGIYGFVGRWAPRGLVSWMMGIRRVDELSTWKASPDDSAGCSPCSDDPATALSHDFIAVPSEGNVWNTETADSSLWVPSLSETS
ncbi:DUF1776-domain-containing protein [Ophiocordyceps camponoti-floridani]|uniref:DUF1776-domain-containing protein n=1 Tax=Ophiocordyceps camponoti-floridani TaxID=2030778 RepID=A0A8H4Q7Z3_9HYPO|nr:DUF1776-domain-containing protein [Ophiocordyceps camponoti-floridani]